MASNRLAVVIVIFLVFVLGILLGIYLMPEKVVEKIVEVQKNTQQTGSSYKELPIVGVDENGKGVTGLLSIEVKPGTGLVLVNINDVLADYLTQLSARNAAKIAENFTSLKLNTLDIVYNIKANASVVEGSSAGAVMAVGTIAALQNKEVKHGIFMTGAIDERGNVIPVAGIPEKASAAKLAKAELFLIPIASYIDGFEMKKRCATYQNLEYCEVDFKGRESDVSKVLGLEVKQVKNIGEVVDYYLK